MQSIFFPTNVPKRSWKERNKKNYSNQNGSPAWKKREFHKKKITDINMLVNNGSTNESELMCFDTYRNFAVMASFCRRMKRNSMTVGLKHAVVTQWSGLFISHSSKMIKRSNLSFSDDTQHTITRWIVQLKSNGFLYENIYEFACEFVSACVTMAGKKCGRK